MTLQQSNYIKFIAIITMLTDHIGLIFFPNIQLFRIIGRIAFPLFAYQLGTGYIHTRNLKKYIIRMFLLGVVLQLVYVLSVYFFDIREGVNRLNIFFTLTLGLIAISLYDNKKHFPLLLLIIFSTYISFFKVSLDYDYYGIGLILIFYALRNNPIYFASIFALFNFFYCYYTQGNFIQMYSLLALLFILRPISLKIKIPSYVFYLFYPFHLALLHAVKMIIERR